MKIQGNYNISHTSRKFFKRNAPVITQSKTQKQTSTKFCEIISPIKYIQEVEKNKSELIKMFDLIHESMAEDSKKIGLDFIKPELVFKKLPKDLNAYYLPGYNKIIVNERKLKPNSTARYKDDNTYLIDTLENGKEIPYCDFALPFAKKLPDDCRYLTQEEKLFMLGATLKHELTHSRQEQIMLSAQGALKDLYEALKDSKPDIYKKITFDDYKKLLKFYGEYKPAKAYAKNEKISFEFQYLKGKDGKSLKIEYTPQDIINCNINYDSDNLNSYYANILEIEARAEQVEYYINYKKYTPNLDIDKSTQDYYLNAILCICQTLLEK